jgi:carboxymethylenebutenolidase
MSPSQLLTILIIILPFTACAQVSSPEASPPDTVEFMSGNLRLKGLLWKPKGVKKFPAVLYNHGSEPRPQRYGSTLAPEVVSRGYAFFLPCRRGQGLSKGQGKYILDELDSAEKNGGASARAALLIQRHETTQLQDQLAALRFLLAEPGIDTSRIVVAGVSFGGIQSMVIAQHKTNIKAVLNFAGGAMNWEKSPAVASWLKGVAAHATVPVYLIQAENDYSTRPSLELAEVLKKQNKVYKMKIYPPQGTTQMDGHSMIFETKIWAADVFPQIDEWIKKK